MDENPDHEIIERELDTEVDEPSFEVLRAIKEIEETEMDELPTIYNCVDGVLSHLFSNPPSPEAQMEVEFSYTTYRITIQQNGTAKFIKTE